MALHRRTNIKRLTSAAVGTEAAFIHCTYNGRHSARRDCADRTLDAWKDQTASGGENQRVGQTTRLAVIAQQFGISPQRVGEVARRKAFIRPRKTWTESGGRFYPRVSFVGRTYALGGYNTAAL